MTQNPFDAPPPDATGQKAYFGRLRLVTNKVNLVKGAAYTEAGLMRQDGTPWEFKGKQKTETGQHTHVIVIIQAKNSQGESYNAFRDFMYWGNDPCQQVTMPSLKQHFGTRLESIFGKAAWVKAVIEEIEDNGYTRQAFKIEEVYPDRQAMETAEVKHFAQFHKSAEEIADEIPGFDDEVPWDEPAEEKPVGMTKEQAVNLLPTLYAASGNDYDKFVKQLEGMPVVIAALGGVDVPEVTKYANNS